MQKHKTFVATWLSLLVFAFLVYQYYWKPRFSIYLTLSSLLNFAANALMAFNIIESGNYEGLSLIMIEFNIVVGLTRMVAIINHSGYLPNDDSGDIFYRLTEIGILACNAFLRFKATEENDAQSNKDLDSKFFEKGKCLGVIAVMALIFKASRNKNWLIDYCWAYALYLESIAFLPQLSLFVHAHYAKTVLSHYLFGSFCSALLGFRFWLASYSEIGHPNVLTGYVVLLMQVFRIALLIDFAYKYLKSLITTGSVNYNFEDL